MPYGIITDSDLFVVDNFKDSKGEPIKGVLVFKKKTNAVTECESLNKLRVSMKLKQCYSVSKISSDDIPSYGLIIDGVWKSKL